MTGAGTLFTGLAPAVGFVIPFQVLAGAGNGVDNVASETLIQQRVPGPMLGRVFGLTGTAANAGASVAALLGGILLDLTSPRTVLVIGGVGGSDRDGGRDLVVRAHPQPRGIHRRARYCAEWMSSPAR